MRRFTQALIVCSLLAAGASQAAGTDLDPQVRTKAQQALQSGLKFLRSKQAPNGSVLFSSGLTALSLRALLEDPIPGDKVDKAAIDRYANYIVSKANPDGSIVERAHDQAYNTAVSIAALAATKDPKYAAVIAAGQKYLVKSQINEARGFAPVDNWYGGIGYGGDERPDVSNMYISLEAMRATAYDPKDPVWQKALVFASRMQNRSESNDQKWAANDGGFIYSPGQNPEKLGGGTQSYASVTAAGLYSLLLIGVDKSDPRVQAAYKWLTTNYTLDTNFGTNSKHTLFYYYSAFARVMRAYGDDEFVDGKGQRHNWRNELAQKLVTLQDPDGSWVNRDSSYWWEDKPELATSWSVLALENVLR